LASGTHPLLTFLDEVWKQVTRLLLVPALAALLVGCVVGGENAQHDMEASKAAYKACLTAREPEACDGLRQAYEADRSAYRATPKLAIAPEVLHRSRLPTVSAVDWGGQWEEG
jgi:hypothetical protein